MSSNGEERFGSDYVLGGELGRGAMGTVYGAHRTSTNRRVAIKILHPHLSSDSKTIGRFVQEREAFGLVDHVNVINVHDLVVERGRLGIVMEFVDGGDLKSVATSKALGIRESLHVVRDIASGLEAIHEADIVHRDLKPANIMVARDKGRIVPKIADFGVSRLLADNAVTTGTAIGTPRYMAPETVGSGPGPRSPADIYALGVILFELLLGSPPFTGLNAMSLIRAHTEDPPPIIRGVPSPLTALVDQMLSKDPSDRPDATSVVAQLNRVVPLVDDESNVFAVEEKTPAATASQPIEPVGSRPPAAPAVAEPHAILPARPLPTTTGQGYQASLAGQPRPHSRPLRRTVTLAVGAVGLLSGLVAIAALAGGFTFAMNRSGPDGEPLRYAFESWINDDDLVITQDWTLPVGERTVSAVVSVANQTGSIVNSQHVELFTSEMVSDLDAVSFDPLPDELLRQDLVVRYLVELGPGGTKTISYSFVVDDDLEIDELSQLAEQKRRASAAYFESETDIQSEVRPSSPLALAPEETETGPDETGADENGPDENGAVETRPTEQIAAPETLLENPVEGPLTVSNMSARSITSSSGRVVFDTSKCTTARYFDEEADIEYLSQRWPDATAQCWTEHGHTFAGLEPSTTYSFMLELRESAGGASLWGPVVFTTLAAPEPVAEPEVEPLEITGFRVINVTQTSARVVWESSQCATSQIELDGVLTTPEDWPSAEVRCWESHGRNYDGLEPDVEYSVVVRVAVAGRIVSAGPITFTTEASP